MLSRGGRRTSLLWSRLILEQSRLRYFLQRIQSLRKGLTSVRSSPSAGFEPASALTQLLAILRVARGVSIPKGVVDTPRYTPTKPWLHVELGGRGVEEARAYRYEASICGPEVYGSQWTSTDVLGWLPGPDSNQRPIG